MKQLSVQITKPVVLRHEDGQSKEGRNEADGEKEKKGEDNVTTGNVLEVQYLCFPCR